MGAEESAARGGPAAGRGHGPCLRGTGAEGRAGKAASTACWQPNKRCDAREPRGRQRLLCEQPGSSPSSVPEMKPKLLPGAARARSLAPSPSLCSVPSARTAGPRAGAGCSHWGQPPLAPSHNATAGSMGIPNSQPLPQTQGSLLSARGLCWHRACCPSHQVPSGVTSHSAASLIHGACPSFSLLELHNHFATFMGQHLIYDAIK